MPTTKRLSTDRSGDNCAAAANADAHVVRRMVASFTCRVLYTKCCQRGCSGGMPYAARCRLHVVFCIARASVRPRAARYMNARTPIRMHASANGKQRRRPKTVLQENAQLASLWGCLRSSELVLAGPRRSHLHHPGRSRRTPRVRKERADAPFNFPIQSIPAAVWPQTSACPLPHGVTAGY